MDIIPSLAEGAFNNPCVPPSPDRHHPLFSQHLLHRRPPPTYPPPTHPPNLYLSVNTLPLPPCLALDKTNCFDTLRQFATAFNFPFPFAFYPGRLPEEDWRFAFLFIQLVILITIPYKMAPSSTLVAAPRRAHDLSSMKSPIFSPSLSLNSHRRCEFISSSSLSHESFPGPPNIFCATNPCSYANVIKHQPHLDPPPPNVHSSTTKTQITLVSPTPNVSSRPSSRRYSYQSLSMSIQSNPPLLLRPNNKVVSS